MVLQVDKRLRDQWAAEVLCDGKPSVDAALEMARRLSLRGVRPGSGGTLRYLSVLATLGLVDATLARIVEPHLDATAILAQAGVDTTPVDAQMDSTWGVYAANAPGYGLQANRDAAGWILSGTKPWCSLASQLSHAVITATRPDGRDQAFAVRLDPDRVAELPTLWVSRGLTEVPSGGIGVRDLPAVPVGEPGWYLERAGFGWGAVGVAAVWYGIALGLREHLVRHVAHREGDQILRAQLGSVDRDLFAASACLYAAACQIDTVPEERCGTAQLASRVRAVVAAAVENVMAVTGRALGPGPLTGDESYARRMADLTVYVRQHHGERDLAALGAQVADEAAVS